MHRLVWQSTSDLNRHLNEMPLLLEWWHLALEWNNFVPSVVRNFIRVKWWRVPRERGSLSGKKLYYGQVRYQREGGSLSSENFYYGQIIEGTEREKKKSSEVYGPIVKQKYHLQLSKIVAAPTFASVFASSFNSLGTSLCAYWHMSIRSLVISCHGLADGPILKMI